VSNKARGQTLFLFLKVANTTSCTKMKLTLLNESVRLQTPSGLDGCALTVSLFSTSMKQQKPGEDKNKPL
jgi:hypothetical protein